jgi:hypothetical protein
MFLICHHRERVGERMEFACAHWSLVEVTTHQRRRELRPIDTFCCGNPNSLGRANTQNLRSDRFHQPPINGRCQRGFHVIKIDHCNNQLATMQRSTIQRRA